MQEMRTNKPRIAVFVTGGTIVCHFDEESNRITPALTGEQLIQSVSGLSKSFNVELIEFSNMPGPHLTPQIGVELAKQVQSMLDRDDISGAVVVQGTDTLEEMAYLLDLLIDGPKPVVFTGAMKSNDELYSDAQGNLLGAIRIAACEEARGCGVMVFFNQDILAARYAVKADANNMNSFRARETGPMGMVTNEKVVLFNRTPPSEHFTVKNLNKRIELIKATCGMSTMLLECCIRSKVDGIVIEGLGAGNLPPSMVPLIKEAISSKIPVVMTTRCPEGFAVGTYAYEGGGAGLESMGVIYGGDLNGQKARIKLMVLCDTSSDPLYLKTHF